MTNTTSDAFDHAASRTEAGGCVPDATRAWARRILDLRREDGEAESCPPAFVARARALLAEKPASLLERVARLVYDSAAGPAPALRGKGTSRLWRFERAGVKLDVELAPCVAGARQVHLAVEPPHRAADAWLVLPGRPEPVVVTLDGHGTGRAGIPADTPSIVVHVFSEYGELLCTPAMDFESAA